jgi:hypothetical protein
VFEHLIEALAVELGRIIRLESQMNVGDLSDQHVRRFLEPTTATMPLLPGRFG